MPSVRNAIIDCQLSREDMKTFIQWKGTQVCMDVWCDCGMSSHWDEEFLYYLQCPGCKKTFSVGTNVELVEADPDGSHVAICEDGLHD